MSLTIHQILIKYWGYSTFRPLQEDIIMSVFNGHDTLALLPTGGGKSICFQVPALAMDGVCIVITPLIALMKDQVQHLQSKGIKALAIFSGMNRHEIDIALDRCVYGDIKFLYVSPERLQTEIFIERLKKMMVCLLAVDESHCVSQWGYDFRPPYLQIAEIRKYIPKAPVLALTATATLEVVKDIQDKLLFKKENVFQKSFERKNLIYVVLKTEDKQNELLSIIKSIKHGAGIVYARSRKKTKEIANVLEKNGVSADFYHAGLDQRLRDKKQNDWMQGVKRVIVATNAFGMGIDKPNVRFVLHLDIPESIEAYFQEAGRAGRDEQRANAILLYSDADIIMAKNNFELSFPKPEEIKRIYNALGNYFQLAVGSGLSLSFDFSIADFSDNYKMNPAVVFNGLKFLEREGLILLTEAIYAPSKINIHLNKEQLYKFQVANAYYDNFIKVILRTYGGVFDEYVRINEDDIARKLNLKTEDVVKILEKLKQSNIINYEPQKNKPQIIFTQERLDAKQIYISPEIYANRKKVAADKLEAILNYVSSSTKCRSQLLLEYFGEKYMKRCGACDICKKRNEIEANEIEFNTVVDKIKPLLRTKEMDTKEIVAALREIPEEKIRNIIRWLIENNKVTSEDGVRIKWKS